MAANTDGGPERRVLGAAYCAACIHERHEERPADPEAPEVALRWPEGGRNITVIRARGRIVHPGCRAFAETGTCPHVRRAIALTERPFETLADDITATWGEWGHLDPRRWAAAVAREADQARDRADRLARFHARPARDRDVAAIVARFGRPTVASHRIGATCHADTTGADT